MRIKKKYIKENLDLDDMKNTVQSTDELKSSFEDIGIEEPEAASLAADLVSSAFSDDDVNEEATSDSQRKFFNAVYKCKTDGDCPSKSIKDAADNMSLSDIEDFAFTKGKLPNSVEEDYPNDEDFGDIPTGRDLEVDGDDYEEYQKLLKQVGNSKSGFDSTKIDDGLPFESVKPKMTKNELMETVMRLDSINKKNRRVIKTLKVKDLRK
jgi:hypothetical protein